MFKNHLKVAWRNLKNNRIFSIINVLGLSLGLAITILLFLFVSYEHSYDSMYENKADIHRVLVRTGDSFDNEVFCTAPAAVAPALKEEVPEVKHAARMLKHDFGEPAFIKVNDVNLIEKELYYCDPELFTIFGIDIIKGQPSSALERPNTTMVSQSTAIKYFGDQNPIGKIITVDNRKQLEIVSVFKDFPSNSTLHCNVIASFSSTNFAKNATWGNSSFETYVQLEKNTSIAGMESQLQKLLNKNVDKEGQWFTLGLQPLEKVHLYSSDYTNSYTTRIGNIKEIKNLSILALLILIIACINYMNLITARSQKRAKDVGINKTLGASLKNMIIRFYAETGLITFIALLIGLVIAITAVPIFNVVTSQEMDISLLINFKFLLGLIAFWVLTTLVAGSYPAFYLSSSSPKNALSSSSGKVGGVISIRKGLVVLQFAASAILIVAVLVIYQQLQFMQSKKLGYNPENVVAISTSAIRGADKKEALLQEFRSLSNVSSVALAQGFPGIRVSGRTLLKDENDSKGASIQTNHADATTLDVLQLKLLAGSNLPKVKQEGDTIVDVVLNEKAVAYLGFNPEEAIGQKVTMSLGDNAYVKGVVEDFNFSSLHRPIGGYAFHNSPREPKYFVLVRFNSKSTNAVMDQLETIFNRVITNSVFEYTFLDKKIESLYSQERKVATVGLIFCVLAIFVACLGLFGLAAYTAEQRKKEIGVRKVLGATVMGIAQMLSKDFLKLVLVSLLIAFPIAFIVMQNWLEEFAYRINVNWSVFVIAAMSAFLIAIITVSFQAVKAAMTNPVNSLRTE